MKVMINHVCGCVEEHNISGKIEGREYRIARLEERKCYNCWTKEQAEKETGKVEIVEMHYGEYKNSNYTAVPDSYDRRTKTIKVYVPVKEEHVGDKDEVLKEVVEEIKENLTKLVVEEKYIETTKLDAMKEQCCKTTEKYGITREETLSAIDEMIAKSFKERRKLSDDLIGLIVKGENEDLEVEIITEIKDDIMSKLVDNQVILTDEDLKQYRENINKKADELNLDKNSLTNQFSAIMQQYFKPKKGKEGLILTLK